MGDGDRVPDRRRAVRGGRLHRHERRRALERPHGRGGEAGREARARRRLQGRLGDRIPRRRARTAGRCRLLLGAHRSPEQLVRLGDRRPDRPRVRRFADLRLRATRRRHLHEGGRRRRRPRGEDRGGHPGRRPAQPGRDRGQRRGQRRRLRRHGGRPVRDVRRHRGRRDADRDAVPDRRALALPARDRRHLDPLLRDRHVLRAHRPRRLDHERALQERDRRHRPLGDRLHPDHARLRRLDVQLLGAVPAGADRPRGHVRARRHHRVLHGQPLAPGEGDRRGVADRARDEHHRRASRTGCRRRPRR